MNTLTCSFCKLHNPRVESVFLTHPCPHEISFIFHEQQEDNNDSVPIVAVHGLTRTAHDFDVIGHYLSKSFPVFALDMPGRGRSSNLESPGQYSYDTYISDCSKFLEHIGGTQFNWIGTSMGGIIGMLLASQPESRIKKLVLNDIGYMVPRSALCTIATYVSQFGPYQSYEEAAYHLKKTYGAWNFQTEEEWDRFIQVTVKVVDDLYYLHYDPQIAESFVNATADDKDIDLSMFWENVNIPVLLLRGENSDVLPRSVADKMAQKSNCTLIEIPDCGHCPNLLTDLQIAAIESFLCE
ncbi:hypothetical protein RCL1_006455 [Eukaryota sp. TZLM3-RCL]